MDDIELPKVRPSQARRNDLEGLASDVGTFLPKRLSKEGRRREQKLLEEVRIRVVVTKAGAVLEKLAVDYRFAAKRYEITRLVNEIDYYDSLIAVPQSKAGKDVAKQAVEQFVKDLYATIWDIAQTMDEKTRVLIEKELYPEEQETRDWLDSLGVWLGRH